MTTSVVASESQTKPFHLLETTVDEVHEAFKSGSLTARRLVEL